MKSDDEKCTQAAQRAKTAVQTREVMQSPAPATTAIRRPSRAELMVETKSLICKVSGIRGERVAERILRQLEAMQRWASQDAAGIEGMVAAFEMMNELKPASVMEAMLSVQIVGVHEAALMFLKRATAEGQTFEGADANVLRATRLLRLFNEQLEAMAKLKGKARQQKVTVEHVHVHSGGQAIVGSVTAGEAATGEGTK